MTTPDISIVVCTYNRADMLRGALASLYNLATDGAFTYEIVVIDNASTDATPAAIAACAAESPTPLRGVYEPQKGVVAARNRGIREAQGRWIAFFDDDQFADSHWLAELYRGATENQCRVVGGAVRLLIRSDIERDLHPTVRMLLGEAFPAPLPTKYGGRLTPGCGNLMVERSVFDEVGTFQAAIDGRGEDTDLFERIERAGIDAWYFPSAIIDHLTPSDRLTNDYLVTLAGKMGRGIGMRRGRDMNPVKFNALWLAKAAYAALVQLPRVAIAKCRGDRETALGRQCQLAITCGFLRGGCEVYRGPARTAQPNGRALSAPQLSGANWK